MLIFIAANLKVSYDLAFKQRVNESREELLQDKTKWDGALLFLEQLDDLRTKVEIARVRLLANPKSNTEKFSDAFKDYRQKFIQHTLTTWPMRKNISEDLDLNFE